MIPISDNLRGVTCNYTRVVECNSTRLDEVITIHVQTPDQLLINSSANGAPQRVPCTSEVLP
jgi:hypothetical protein